jgi:NAD(P)-dependent dehydrogenase (short-subunit alcohol dehydrogenase family)
MGVQPGDRGPRQITDKDDRSSSLAVRLAVVTGGSRGIGQATALALGAAGFVVVVTARGLPALQETADLMAASGYRCCALACDVSKERDVRRVFRVVRQRYGRVDVLVNNAGIAAEPASIEKLTLETWQRVLATNLTGAFLCTREAFAAMRAQDPMGGRIINNGSVSAQVPRPKAVAYNASKHAITGLTKSTSLEGRPFSIACGQIDIGNAGTGLTAGMSRGVEQADGSTRPEPTFDVSLVAQAIVYMATLPLEANVQSMTVVATTMPYIGRG